MSGPDLDLSDVMSADTMPVGGSLTSTPPPRKLRERARLRRPAWALFGEKIVEGLVRLCGISTVILVLGIFFFVLREAWPFLIGRFSFREFFTSIEWYPDSAKTPRYGALALLAGTTAVTIGSMAIAVPVGLLSAVYVSELCSPRVREVAKIVVETLAAIPSVVWGFVALTVISPMMVSWGGATVGLNVLNASIVLALMAIPIIVSLGEDALRAVPESYREAAEALGATRWDVITRVVLPAASRGLASAVLLGVGRSMGETMAVLMATGHAVNIPSSLFDPARTLTATIAAELGESPKGEAHYRALFTLGLALFVITFTVNLIADRLVRGRRSASRAKVPS